MPESGLQSCVVHMCLWVGHFLARHLSFRLTKGSLMGSRKKHAQGHALVDRESMNASWKSPLDLIRNKLDELLALRLFFLWSCSHHCLSVSRFVDFISEFRVFRIDFLFGLCLCGTSPKSVGFGICASKNSAISHFSTQIRENVIRRTIFKT